MQVLHLSHAETGRCVVIFILFSNFHFEICAERNLLENPLWKKILLSSFFFAKAVDLGDYNAGKNNVTEFLLSGPGFHHTVIFCVEMVLDF